MATVSKRGASWYGEWRENGHRHRRSLGRISEQDAQTWLKCKEAELATGQVILPQQTVAPLFKPFASDYMAWYEFEHPASAARLESIIRLHLIPVFGHLPLDQIKAAEVEGWKIRRKQQGAKPDTINKELRAFKAMLNRAVDWEIIDRHPFDRVKGVQNTESKVPHWYTRDEMQALYKVSGDGRWVWQLYANTGMRSAEGLHLKWSEVGRDELQIVSTARERTKSAKYRVIPYSDATRESLERMRSVTGSSAYVLPRQHPKSLSRSFRLAAKRADVGGSLHSLRHTFCTHLVLSGVPLRTVQILAGHSSITVTEKYVHSNQEFLSDAVTRLQI